MASSHRGSARLGRSIESTRSMGWHSKLQTEPLEERRLLAATPELLLDLNAGRDSSGPTASVEFQGARYFFANDGTHGTEMWVTDGTEAGTQLLKDIQPGPGSARGMFDYQHPVVAGDFLYFWADDGTHGTELWKTDGTSAGTQIVRDIWVGQYGSSPKTLFEWDGKLIFVASDIGDNYEPWVTDGSLTGTTKLAETVASTFGGLRESGHDPLFTSLNGELYFVTDTDALWKTNGTAAGTTLVQDFAYFGGEIEVFNSHLYFHAQGPASGRELWKSDGTVAGTTLVKDIVPGASGSNLAGFEVVGDTLYFSEGGDELWKSDGTEAGTELVKKMVYSGSSDRLSLLTNFNGKLVFLGRDTASGWELWESDGTNAGTVLIKDIQPGTGDSGITYLTIWDGALYFAANDGTSGVELWKSDGTTAGTALFHEEVAGPASSIPHDLAVANGQLVFATSSGQLWRTSSTPGSAVPVGVPFKNISLHAVSGSDVYLTGGDRLHGSELWKTDLTDAGTVLVKDINTGSAEASSPTSFVEYQGFTYFIAHGSEIWRTDGTTAGTELVIDGSAAGGFSGIGPLVTFNGSLYFSAHRPEYGSELWKSDGTAAGTAIFQYLTPGSSSSSPANLTVSNGLLFFYTRASSSSSTLQVWASNGTPGGTVKVREGYGGGTAITFKNAGAKTYFVLDTDLYITNGTAGGTWRLKKFGAETEDLTDVNGTLYFTANDGSGLTLWRSNGTVATTTRAFESGGGPASSSPSSLANVNGTLFFATTLRDGTKYFGQLWAGDGTPLGTQLIYSVEVASGASSVGVFPVGDLAFFITNSKEFGTELFVSDGTTAGTGLVKDIRSGIDGADFNSLGVVNNTLFFTANDGSGRTLWTSDGTAAGTVPIGPATPLVANIYDIAGTAYFSLDEPWILRTPSVSVDLDGVNSHQRFVTYWTGAPVAIASPTATLNSAGTTVLSLTARLLSPQPGDLLAADTTGTAITASFDGTVLTLSGEDSAANYAQVLRTITFHGAGNAPSARIEVRAVNAQGHAAVAATSTVFISTKPEVDLNGIAPGVDSSVIWQGNPVNVATPTAAIYDPDTEFLSQLDLVILQSEAGDQLAVDTSGTGITATFGAGWLSLTGLASVELYQQVLRSVTYNYTGASPTFSTKYVEVTPTDAGGLVGISARTTVTFALHVDLNSPWGLVEHSATWTGEPVNVAAPTASILAAGGLQLASLTVQIQNPKADDLLTAVTTGTSITAVFSGGTLTLSGIDTRANYEQVLRSIRYQSTTPTDASRTLRVRVTDQFGSTSNQATTTIKISWEAFIQPLRDIVPGSADSGPGQYVGVGRDIFFTAISADKGRELWKSDGTEAGTVLVKDIRPGAVSSDIAQQTQFGGLVGFTADDGSGAGLWRSDGSGAGTYRLKSGDIHSLIDVDGKLFFVVGDELWKSDGSIAGTTLVKDFDLSIPFEARDLTTVGSLLFFGLDDGLHGTELWKSDGTESGTAMVKNIGPGSQDGLRPGALAGNGLELVNVGGVLYFVADDSSSTKLWKTDGTDAGTVIYQDGSGLDPNNFSALTNLNGLLMMVADTTFDGVEVFTGPGGVVSVNQQERHSSNPSDLTVAGNSLYFTAFAHTDDPVRQLWSYTPGGFATLIYDGVPGAMLGVGDTMFFIVGGQLWHSDGTTQGTKQVMQAGSPMVVSELGSVGDTLYFTADAGKGVEPYVLRLPTAATSVAGRHLLYEDSKFSTPAANPSGGKDAAIAPDKIAYLGTGLATTSAVSSYSRGINGIVVDVYNASHALTAADFTFRVGGSNSPNAWTTAPAPTSVIVRPGMGEGNSDRIEITWADGVIKNTWLQVTVEGNDAAGGFNTSTGLAASDVFYFGSRVGDTFMNAGLNSTTTTAQDELAARSNTGPNQSLTSIYDFNRDGIVTAADQLISRGNVGVLKMLDIDELIAEELAESLVAASSTTLVAQTAPARDSRAAIAFALSAEAFADEADDELTPVLGRDRRR